MPAPSNPPPSSEGGAIIQPRQLMRWLDVNIIHRLTRTQSYITLPAFSVDTQWKGYSEIVATFPLVCTKNFSLKPFTAPLNPNYCLCIMWVDDEYNVYRYKLWGNVGEVFYFDVPDYENQPIHKNCRFEIWSANTNTSILTFNLTGSDTPAVNSTYTYDNGSGLWAGTTYNATLLFSGLWSIVYGLKQIVSNNTTNQLGRWTFSVGSGVAPYGSINNIASQATALTFYTSALGGYDYRFQEDFSLAPASTIVTNFSVNLPSNLPITFPAGSYPVLN